MLPFSEGSCCYIPDGYITGLSKIARLLNIRKKTSGSGETYHTDRNVFRKHSIHWESQFHRSSAYVHADQRVQKQNSYHNLCLTGILLEELTREEFVHLIAQDCIS